MIRLTDKIYYVGVKDPELAVFDIIMDTEFGTSYNSYIVKGEKTALIETAHNKLCDEFIKNIEEIVDISKLDYVVLNHTEPDHSGSLEKILSINPDVTVVGTIAALKNLKEITNRAFNELLAKDGGELDLGGVTLKFIIAPNLHWPDTMMTYCEKERALFSCDVLGTHYCFDGILDTDILSKADYDKSFREYYDCIVSPFKPFVLKGIDKLSGLDIEYAMTSHGPVLTKTISEAVEKYLKWSTPEAREKKSVAIFYVSAYGYTKMLAQKAKAVLAEKGIEAQLIDPTEDNVDTSAIIDAVDGVMLGTPTINRNALPPIWNIAVSLDLISIKDKPFAVFGSYGWSGEGTVLINSLLKSMRVKTCDEPFKVLFKPSDADLEKMADFTLEFASNIL